MNVEVVLDGGLLVAGQVVVGHVRTADVVLLDDVLPCGLRTVVGQIEELDVVVLQAGVLLGGVAERLTARSAPCAPNVEQHELALVGLEDLPQQRLAL